MKKFLPWLALTLVVEFAIGPIGSRFFDWVAPQIFEGLTIVDVPFYQAGFATVFMMGLGAGAILAHWKPSWFGWRNRKLDAFKMKQVGQECYTLGEEIAEFIKARDEVSPDFFTNASSERAAAVASRFSRNTISDFQRKFSGRMEASIAVIHVLYDIKVPMEFTSRAYYYQHDMIRLLLGVGHLLERGHVVEAQKLTAQIVSEQDEFAAPSPVPQKPSMGIHIEGGTVFVPTEASHLTGIALNAKVWSLAGGAAIIDWGLNIIPKRGDVIKGHLSEIPDKLLMERGDSIRKSESLVDKLGSQPPPEAPMMGTLLFYIKAPKDIVLDQDTVLELSAKDIHMNNFSVSQRIGDWLSA